MMLAEHACPATTPRLRFFTHPAEAIPSHCYRMGGNQCDLTSSICSLPHCTNSKRALLVVAWPCMLAISRAQATSRRKNITHARCSPRYGRCGSLSAQGCTERDWLRHAFIHAAVADSCPCHKQVLLRSRTMIGYISEIASNTRLA